MLFAEVENVNVVKDGKNWSIEFDHIDHISKERKVAAHSQFTSESAMAYTILSETIIIIKGYKNEIRFKSQ